MVNDILIIGLITILSFVAIFGTIDMLKQINKLEDKN